MTFTNTILANQRWKWQKQKWKLQEIIHRFVYSLWKSLRFLLTYPLSCHFSTQASTVNCHCHFSIETSPFFSSRSFYFSIEISTSCSIVISTFYSLTKYLLSLYFSTKTCAFSVGIPTVSSLFYSNFLQSLNFQLKPLCWYCCLFKLQSLLSHCFSILCFRPVWESFKHRLNQFTN